MAGNPINSDLASRAAALSIGGLFSFQARYRGNHIALEDANRSYRYSELNERVNRLVNVLAAAGVEHDDRVAVLSENRVEYIELQLAAAKAGAIVAALNWRMAPGELEHCIGLAEPRIILVSERYQETLAGLPHGAEQVICLGEEYESSLASATAAEPLDVAAPEDGLIILYTSGTTGLPKGALISHRAMIARGQILCLDLTPAGEDEDTEEVFVAWAPLFHMVSTDKALTTLTNGGKVIIEDGFDPDRLVAIVARERVGLLVLMPGTIEPFIAAMRRNDARPVGVKAVGAMADLVPRHHIAELTELLQAPYVNSFGSTETGLPPASKGKIKVGQIPQSLSKTQNSYCQVRLVDENDNDVADGEPGELLIRGPSLFSGYWNAPQVNAEDFRGGWFHMGDVFVRNSDGTLHYVDRRKYLIKSGGENIYPAEIERLLLADARIREAVVVRKPDPQWGEVPVAFVVRRDESLTEADVMACCEGKIARYKLPKEVRFVEDGDLERSATGKVKRYELERKADE
jgi:fatty-acyl-CoA synthase